MRRLLLIVSFLGGASALAAKTVTFHFPPPGYKEACKQHGALMESGQTVKAERFAKKYRKAHIWPVFMMNPGEKRTIRFVSDSGFTTSPSTDNDFTIEYAPPEKTADDAENSKYSLEKLTIYRLKIPQKNLEKWQDIVSRHFSSRDDDESKKVPRTNFSEVTIHVDYWKAYTSMLVMYYTMKNKRDSIVNDCFKNSYSNDAELTLSPTGSEIHLVSYKLQTRKAKPAPAIETKTENSESDSRLPESSIEQIEQEAKTEDAVEQETEAEAAEIFTVAPVPPLLFFDAEGDPIVVKDLLQYGPVVLNFTASYCAACADELKLLKELHTQRKQSEAQLLIVDIDKKENQQAYNEKFAALVGQRMPARLQLLYDPYQKNYQKVNGAGEEKLPLTILVGTDGKIYDKVTGFDRSALEKLYKKLETLE